MSERAGPELIFSVNAVAAIRQARLTDYPDPVLIAGTAIAAGAGAVAAQLHADCRDVQVADVERLAEAHRHRLYVLTGRSEHDLSLIEGMAPASWILAPATRHEFSTEGGFDILRWRDEARAACQRLQSRAIVSSVVVDPQLPAIDAAAECEFSAVVLNTGSLAMASSAAGIEKELERLRSAAAHAAEIGLAVHAGRGLNYTTSAGLAAKATVQAIHVGHAIVARAVAEGTAEAVRAMRDVLSFPGE